MPRPSRRATLVGAGLTAALAAVLAALLSSGIWPRSGLGRLPAGLRPQDLNLVLVTLDTTRADRLGCYGYDEVDTPNLDALASDGVLFEQAHSSAPLTLPSHASLFTGKHPPSHGVRDNGGFFLAESEETLAEVLRDEGLATGGFVSAYVLDGRWGIAQGFDSYFDEFDLSRFEAISMGDIQRRGDETLERALSWIRDQAGKRFFAWLHLYDPHSPYEPPEPFASRYAGRPYLGEIAYSDSLIGKLLGELSSQGLTGRTVVVVTGDHGESLGEHSESGHAFFVYGVSTHVPLILSGPYPGLAGRRIARVVRTIDILPTILELLGAPRQAPGVGISLIRLLEDESARRPAAYSESFYPRFHFGWSDLRTLRTDRYRFIEAPRPELYDIATDSGETDNVASAFPLVVERMRELLAEAEREMGESPEAPQPVPVDEETQKRLASLGYIGSTVDTSGMRSADLPDPKDKIDIVNRMHAAREDHLRGDSSSAIEKLQGVIADAPEVIDAHFRLANAYAAGGRLEEALEMYRKTLSLKPDHDWAVVGMADAYVDLGRIDDAILGYRTFLKRDPANENVTYRLAETLLDAGRLEEAGAMFRKVLEIWPRRVSAVVGLAAVALKRSDPRAARAEIQRALAIDPTARNAHYNLALALEAEGDPAGAMAAYRSEIALREQAASASQASKARFNLARLLGQAGDRQGQVRELQAALRDNPDFILGRYFLAKALLDAADLAGAEEQARRALAMAPDHYYAPLGHYVLADIFNRRGRPAEAQEEARQGRILESRGIPRPPS